jgi:hypothetical protein
MDSNQWLLLVFEMLLFLLGFICGYTIGKFKKEIELEDTLTHICPETKKEK